MERGIFICTFNKRKLVISLDWDVISWLFIIIRILFLILFFLFAIAQKRKTIVIVFCGLLFTNLFSMFVLNHVISYNKSYKCSYHEYQWNNGKKNFFWTIHFVMILIYSFISFIFVEINAKSYFNRNWKIFYPRIFKPCKIYDLK